MLSAVIPSVHGYPAMRLAAQLVHQRYVHPGPLVLRTAPLKSPTPTADRDQTVSRRFEPSSRTALIGEQPNPWDLLQPQDAMSRHRGRFPIGLREPSRASVTLWEATAPVKLPTRQCPRPGSRARVRHQNSSGWYFTVGSTDASAPASQPPTYPTQTSPSVTVKLE